MNSTHDEGSAQAEEREYGQEQQRRRAFTLPLPPLSLVGRERELDELRHLLLETDARLLTLTGAGGVGKTRLAVQVAQTLSSAFRDGIYFIPLAAIRTPAHVAAAIAQALQPEETDKAFSYEQLQAYLQPKQLLLLLDNFEQALPAITLVNDLLTACPNIKLLLTSREALRLRGEQRYQIAPLAMPESGTVAQPEIMGRYPAIALFVQRAQAVQPDFTLTDVNASVVAEICRRLDGLPLAIELAAARINMLSPESLFARLNHRLQLLSRGSRDLPARQQTLRDTLKWSYDLLDAQEQQLFRRFAVFSNGCTLRTLEQLVRLLGDEADTVLDEAHSLLEKSLLQPRSLGEEVYLSMLETTHEYALELLQTSSEAQTVHRAHALLSLYLAEEAEPELEGPRQAHWLQQLDLAREDLHAALHWLLESEGTEQETQERRELALRLAGALRRFWLVRGYFNEGRHFLELALQSFEGIGAQRAVQAKAMHTFATLASLQGDYEQAEMRCRMALVLYKQLGNARGCATALYLLGRLAWTRGNLNAACAFAEEALVNARVSGHQGSIAWSLFRLARLMIEQGSYARGCNLLEENLARHRALGNKRGIASSLYHLAWARFISLEPLHMISPQLDESFAIFTEVGEKEGIAFCLYLSGRIALNQAEPDKARSQLEKSLALFEGMGHREGRAWSLFVLGQLAAALHDTLTARARYQESLELGKQLDNKELIAAGLEELGKLIANQTEYAATDARWAAQMWGAAEALRENIGIPLFPCERASYEQAVSHVRTHLHQMTFHNAWTQGRKLTPEQAMSGPQIESGPPLQPAPISEVPDGALATLTAREAEVLRLVALGLTSAQIAERLTITLLTVNSHVRSIYSKLAVTNRSGATRYAIEHKLI